MTEKLRLHAAKIEFIHPFSKKTIQKKWEALAPLPSDHTVFALAYAFTNTEINLVGDKMLELTGADFSLLKVEDVDLMNDIARYSLRISSRLAANQNAGEIVRKIIEILPNTFGKNEGGGQKAGAGFTVQGAPKDVLNAFNLAIHSLE